MADDTLEVTRRFVEVEINDLLEMEEGLSPWEVEFVESVSHQFNDGPDLTDKQVAKLHEIWDLHLGDRIGPTTGPQRPADY